MQPGRGSEGSQARSSSARRRAYNAAMNSKTAGYFGIGITPMSGSEPAAVESPAVQQIDESEEENSYDKNDDMSEEDEFVGGSHIEISDDGGGNAGGRPR